MTNTNQVFLVDFWFSEHKLIDLMSNYLMDKVFKENPNDKEKLSHYLTCVLEKPCLNYTFQNVQDIFNDSEQSYYDLLFYSDIEDDEEYNKEKLKDINGNPSDTALSLVDSNIIIVTDKSKLKNLIKLIWTFIINKSIKTPPYSKKEEYDHLIWFTKNTSAELIKHINNFCDTYLTYIDDLVNYTLEVDVHVLDDCTCHFQEEDMELLTVDALTELNQLNVWNQ